MKTTIRRTLRYMQGVKAVPTMRADQLVDQVLTSNAAIMNTPASRKFFYEDKHSSATSVATSVSSEGMEEVGSGSSSTRHRLAQLRLGGAQLLAPTRASINNNNEGHPLYFAQTSPRQAGLCLPLVQALQRLRIHRLTELQGALIPILLKGKHVIAHAETGTGKSFGIALATVNRILRESVNHRLHTLILVPTEELALQYDKWLRHFGGCASQIVQAALDSIPLESQLAKLHNVHPHVLVGTPQRIADINKASPMILGEKLRRKVDCIILDEADLILTAEVMHGRTKITGADLVDRLYRSRHEEVPAQMVATSATIDGATAQRLNSWMRNDKAVRLTTSFSEHTIPETISFYFFAASKLYSLETCLALSLKFIFREHPNPKILIFTSRSVEDLVDQINKISIAEVEGGESKQGDGKTKPPLLAGSLHEAPDPTNPNQILQPKQLVSRNKEIYVRNGTNLAKLNDGSLRIGVGHYDICRGLHVTHVTHVIMYGEAPTTGDFVHCAGRTGRMGREGDVLCLFPPQSGRAMMTICNAVEIPFTMHKMKHIEEMLQIDGFASSAAAVDGEEQGESKLELARRALRSLQREEVAEDGAIRDPFVRERVLDEIRAGELVGQLEEEHLAWEQEGHAAAAGEVEKRGADVLVDDGNLAWSIME